MHRIAVSLFGSNVTNFQERWGIFADNLTGLKQSHSRKWDSSCSAIVFIDFTEKDYADLLISPIAGPKILILVEPPAVNPFQYNQKILKIFNKIYSFSIETANEYGAQYIPFMTPTRNWVQRRKISAEKPKFGLLAANKNSVHPKSQYWLRRKVVTDLSHKNLNFSFAGPSWEKNRFSETIEDFRLLRYHRSINSPYDLHNLRFGHRKPSLRNFKGKVASKEEYVRDLDVEICIENCQDELSEKIFDSLQIGNVPVYVGVDLSKYGISNDVAFIPPRNPKDFFDFLTSLSLPEINEKREYGYQWWKLNHQKWSETENLSRFASEVRRSINSC